MHFHYLGITLLLSTHRHCCIHVRFCAVSLHHIFVHVLPLIFYYLLYLKLQLFFLFFSDLIIRSVVDVTRNGSWLFMCWRSIWKIISSVNCSVFLKDVQVHVIFILLLSKPKILFHFPLLLLHKTSIRLGVFPVESASYCLYYQ